MRYQVPQFIEVEDKIFGPLTFKQFVYLLGAGGFTFFVFRLLPSFFAFLVAAPIIILGLALAFYKVNSKPFILVLEAAFRYAIGAKLYIWKKDVEKVKPKKSELIEKKGSVVKVPKLSSSKLDDIAWSLDVNEEVE
jgi:hypothetical protein